MKNILLAFAMVIASQGLFAITNSQPALEENTGYLVSITTEARDPHMVRRPLGFVTEL